MHLKNAHFVHVSKVQKLAKEWFETIIWSAGVDKFLLFSWNGR